MNNKPNTMFPMDLAPKIALVKPTDSKGATVQTSTFRTISQPGHMRVVMPAGTVATPGGTAQIIQTHIMPQIIKQGDGGVRTQITALPSTARTLSQTSITVTRSPTPNSFVQRGSTTVSNLGPRGVTMSAPIRAPTPPSSTAINNISNFVRGPIPGRTPSPAGTTILSPGTTWMTSGSPPVQLIRASISQSPRGRVPASSISNNNNSHNNNNTTIVSSQQQQQQLQSQQQIVTSQHQQQQQQQTFVSTVMPPRQATLIYSNVTNPQQQFTTTPNQRLAVATPILGQRPIRPIQIGNARLTTGVRVSTANLSIRGPSIPVLAPANVLSVNALQQARNTTNNANAGNLSGVTGGLPAAARIIQVQQPQSGAPAQVINAGRLSGNLMTLHPVIMNTSATGGTGGGGGANRQTITAKVQPSLTITHVGKLGGAVGQQQQQPQMQLQSGVGGPIGIVTSTQQHQTIQQGVGGSGGQHQHQPQQITQIVGVNQSGGHQIQIVGGSNIPVSGGVVPLTITSRGLAGSVVSAANATTGQVVRNASITTSTVLPIAKVLPQQQTEIVHVAVSAAAASNLTQQNVFLHTRSPNPSVVTSATNFMPNSGAFYYEPISTLSSGGGGPTTSGTVLSLSAIPMATSSSNNLGAPSSTSVTYAPVSNSSFAVVPTNRAVSQQQSQVHGMIVSSAAPQLLSTSLRFNNAQLQVDGNQPQPQHQQLQVQQQSHGGGNVQQQIITVQQQSTGSVTGIGAPHKSSQVDGQPQQPQAHVPTTHMLLSAKVAATIASVASAVPAVTSSAGVTTSPRPTILRKRDNEGIPKSAVKNLGPTLSQMSGPTNNHNSHSGATATNNHSNLPAGITINTAGGLLLDKDAIHSRISSPISPARAGGSSDGSTTVSATSSPGIDQQEEREHTIKMNMRIPELAYKAVEDMYHKQAHSQRTATTSGSSGTSKTTSTAALAAAGPIGTAGPSSVAQLQKQHSTTSGSSNGSVGAIEDVSPRKKPRKQNMNEHSNASKKFPPIDQATFPTDAVATAADKTTTPGATGATQHVRSNKENSKPPTEVYIKKTRQYTMLENYKPSWKPANNHFQRYSDVKPREERPTTVMDLANQASVMQKVNGWKIFHLNAQMEDLAEIETQVYGDLATMLKRMEGHHKNGTEDDRINDLIKGNMQRSKIVSEGINDACAQIMKIFDHKAPVADIIQRCASKRNFKKRFKQLF